MDAKLKAEAEAILKKLDACENAFDVLGSAPPKLEALKKLLAFESAIHELNMWITLRTDEEWQELCAPSFSQVSQEV